MIECLGLGTEYSQVFICTGHCRAMRYMSWVTVESSCSELLDLKWVLSSPPLLKAQSGHDVIDTAAVFESPESIDEAHFKNWCEGLEPRRRTRLGLYFEDLILYAIQHLSAYQLLAHDIQVFKDAQTIGAFDFIVRAPDGETEHWEAAIKFFLQSEPTDGWAAWIGPNGRDSLHRKMTKMLGRQIHLSDHLEAQSTLAELKIPTPTRKRILSKGILFQPHFERDWPIAQAAHPAQPKGRWMRVIPFLSYLDELGQDSLWKLRLRPDWMACVQAQSSDQLYTTAQLKGVLHGHTRAIMLSEIHPDGCEFHEVHRWFVLAETWPHPQLEH